MKLSYYPGCSAHGTGRELDESTRELCNILDVELVDIEDWNCCGASSAHTVDHDLGLALAARNLAIAEKTADKVLTPCSACFARLASARHHILSEGQIKGVEEATGSAEVSHILSLFSQPELLEKMAEKIGEGLKGLKLVCYYGCLTSRPPEVTEALHPENPVEMDNILSALGADVMDWPYKTQCCGGSLTMTKDTVVEKLSGGILDMASRHGAEAVVTGCPMCFMNLERQWKGNTEGVGKMPIPVFYFTELMLLALKPEMAKGYFKRHLSDPSSILVSRDLT